MFYKKLILLLLFNNIWYSCDAKIELRHIVEHVNHANVSWKVSRNG